MKVLVTGATGFIGSWVVRELLAAGHAARVLVRGSSNLENLAPFLPRESGGTHEASRATPSLTIERALGDVLDRSAVRAALTGCDAVIHTAGIAHFAPDDPEHMRRVNVEGVEIVLGTARELGIGRAVLTSSVAALGGSPTPRIADENTPSNAESTGLHYSISKLHGEQAALRLGAQGLDVRVIRPSMALGPGDIFQSSATTILALARRTMPVYVAGGASFGDVREMARAHVAALDRGRPGEIYIVAGHNLSITELVQLVARMTGVPAPRQVPYPLAYAVAAATEQVSRLLKRKSDLSRQLAKASSMYTFASSSKAERELGYRIPPMTEILRDTFRFFLETGRLKATTPELAAMLPGK